MTTTIVVQNSFPNQSHTAELEFTRRLNLCAQRQSINVHVSTSSSDLTGRDANFLLNFHEVSPKLTSMPTIGIMWNPPSAIRRDPTRCSFVASYDGYVSASSSVSDFITEQAAKFSGPKKPLADFNFFPTSPTGIAEATNHQSLAYLGVHWDGDRHGKFLNTLARSNSIALYGPEDAWRHVGEAYRGSIPFDGVSVIRRLAEHGIVLCLHRDAHIAEDTPSMRLFEAASAGCLIFSDNIPFARKTFGESIFILPEGENRTEFVREKVAWARANQKQARDMARQSQNIFNRQYSLDFLLPKLINFGDQVSKDMTKRKLTAFARGFRDRVDVLFFARAHRTESVDQAVQLVNSQIHHYIHLIIIKESRTRGRIQPRVRPRFGVTITEIVSPEAEGNEFSHIISNTVTSPFFTILNENCTWSKDHIAALLKALKFNDESFIAFAGRVLILQGGSYVKAPNFGGDIGNIVPENRFLDHLHHKSSELHSMHATENIDLISRSDWLINLDNWKKQGLPLAFSRSAMSKFCEYTSRITDFELLDNFAEAPPIEFC